MRFFVAFDLFSCILALGSFFFFLHLCSSLFVIVFFVGGRACLEYEFWTLYY